jgi:hypothetical protein
VSQALPLPVDWRSSDLCSSFNRKRVEEQLKEINERSERKRQEVVAIQQAAQQIPSDQSAAIAA